MNEWKDFESILTETANWNQKVIEEAHLDFERKESLLKDKIKNLELQLEQSEEKIVALTPKIQHLVSNYAAFEPVLELKNRLTQKVEDLEKEKLCMTETHLAKEMHFKELLETTIKTNEERLNDLQMSSKEKLEAKEAEWKATIEAVRDRIKILETVIANVNSEHNSATEASKRQHHEELEILRGQISHLQRSLSSKNMTNLDVFASKLQSAKEEFEQSLRDKNEEIREVKSKLKSAEDDNRYLKMVAVVRNVPDDQHKQISGRTNQRSSKNSTEVDRLTETKRNIDPETEKENLNDTFARRSSGPGENDPSNTNLAKLSKKRKLFSASSVLL